MTQKTNKEPYAIVQLRPENKDKTALSNVGFQTQMKWEEQKWVFRLIPGHEKAEFLSYGVIHRNTFIKSPLILKETLQMKNYENIFFAGQITGVEGCLPIEEMARRGLETLRYGPMNPRGLIDPKNK